jgi:hypothetical protein
VRVLINQVAVKKNFEHGDQHQFLKRAKKTERSAKMTFLGSLLANGGPAKQGLDLLAGVCEIKV